MNTFDETKHPRGQVGNAGQFASKISSAPTATLTAPGFVEYDEPKQVDARDLLPGDMIDLAEQWKYGGGDVSDALAMYAETEYAVVESVETHGTGTAIYLTNAPANVFVNAAMKIPVAGRDPQLVEDESTAPAFGIEAPSDGALRAARIEVEARAGAREVSDTSAAVIAADALHNLPFEDARFTARDIGDFRRLRSVAGHPESFTRDERTVRELHDELAALYASPYLGGPRKERINMLFTWASNGSDND